jgi:hypothetical protein
MKQIKITAVDLPFILNPIKELCRKLQRKVKFKFRRFNEIYLL